MRILIVPEDFRKDQYLLEPLFKRLLRPIGRHKMKIRVCQNPLLGGINEALKSDRLREIVNKYDGMIDIFILCVDRDGEPSRKQRLEQLEAEFGENRVFFAENAWEEIETWVLAGLDLPPSWRWAEVRAEKQVKERYFEPLVLQRCVSTRPGRGREALGEEASRRIAVIRRKCPEDFDALAQRLEAAI